MRPIGPGQVEPSYSMWSLNSHSLIHCHYLFFVVSTKEKEEIQCSIDAHDQTR